MSRFSRETQGKCQGRNRGEVPRCANSPLVSKNYRQDCTHRWWHDDTQKWRFYILINPLKSRRFLKDFKMFSRIQDGPIQETGPLAVYEGSARLKMMPFWFGFGRGELFFKRRALLVGWTKDQPAWRRHLLFHLILRLSGRQSERRGNNVMCLSTVIEHKNESVVKR